MSDTRKGTSLRLKTFISVIVVALILCGTAIAMSIYTFTGTNEASFRERAHDLALTVSMYIDGDELRTVADSVLGIYRDIPDSELVTSDEWDTTEFD